MTLASGGPTRHPGPASEGLGNSHVNRLQTSTPVPVQRLPVHLAYPESVSEVREEHRRQVAQQVATVRPQAVSLVAKVLLVKVPVQASLVLP